MKLGSLNLHSVEIDPGTALHTLHAWIDLQLNMLGVLRNCILWIIFFLRNHRLRYLSGWSRKTVLLKAYDT